MALSAQKRFSFLKSTIAQALGLALVLSAGADYAAHATSPTYIGSPPAKQTETQKLEDANNAEEQKKKNQDAATKRAMGEGAGDVRSPDTDCRISSNLGSPSCAGTQTLIDVTTGASAVGGVVGAAAVQVIGNNAQQSASTTGKLSDSYRGAASTGYTAANIQMVLGTMDLVSGTAVTYAGLQHNTASKALIKDTSGTANQLLREDKTAGQFVANDGDGSAKIVTRMLSVDGMLDDDKKALHADSTSIAGKELPKDKVNFANGAGPKTGDNANPNYSGSTNFTSAENAKNAALLTKQIHSKGTDGALEQKTMYEKAKGAGIGMLIKGAGELMAGYLAKKAADEANAAAGQLDQIDDKLANAPVFSPGVNPSPTAPLNFGSFTPSPVPAGDGVAPPAAIVSAADPFSPHAATVLSPGATASGAPAPPDDAKKADGGGLGNPFTPSQPTSPPGAMPGLEKLTDRGAGGAPGGAGGGGLGGAPTTAATDPGAGEGVPRLASNQSDKYENGGGVFSGGSGGAVGADKGPDLSALLAALTKDEKKDNGQSNNIMDYGRAPASEGGDAVSLLDKSVNIFERVHETYQDKSRQGVFGLGLAKLAPKGTGG